MKKQILTVIASAALLAGCANLCEVNAPCSKKADLSIGSTLFAFDSAVLTSQAETTLNKMAKKIKESGKKAQVNGYTDITGNSTYNLHLSQERAKAVAKYLQDKGVAKQNLSTKGYGATDFVATNNTKEGRAQNRRVDIVLE